ncbi:MAG: sugar phosphate nucleotidyltransferase [Planctomycetes bacterium]|nr:sugar phosphate nucleotidyltransferase [Planctomycetota bacterium]
MILAGGSGTRFWPLSRTNFPKQFLDVEGRGESLLRGTLTRNFPLVDASRVFVIAGEKYRDALAKELPELPPANFIFEPMGRDTAPAVALLTLYVALKEGPESIVAILPADHVISPREKWQSALADAARLAEESSAIVTFGIAPTFPSTQFGYIESKPGEAKTSSGLSAFDVSAFREKPDKATAEKYVAGKRHFWNAGIFIFRAKTMLDELRNNAADIIEPLEAAAEAYAKTGGLEMLREVFPTIRKTSIDYAVMEKARNIKVIASDFAWDDVGAFDALRGLRERDEAGNVVEGPALLHKATDSIVLAKSGRKVILAGLDGVLCVDTGDALLVAPADKPELIKEIALRLKSEGCEEVL